MVGASAFDAIDRNHDGVITRQELNQAMYTGPAQPVSYSVPARTYPTTIVNDDYGFDGGPRHITREQLIAEGQLVEAPGASTQDYYYTAPSYTAPATMAPATVAHATPTYAVPTASYAAPLSTVAYAQPSASLAGPSIAVDAPVYMRSGSWAAEPTQVLSAPSMFDSMDRNHDGVISRQEFNQAMQQQMGSFQQAPQMAPALY